MKYKKGLIFVCLLLCLITMASVVAADVNETAVASEDQVIIDENDDVLAVEEQDNEDVD